MDNLLSARKQPLRRAICNGLARMAMLGIVGIAVAMTVSVIEVRADAQDFKTAALARPWESRPYLVTVWICSDNDPALISSFEQISEGVVRRALLIDPCGWDVTVQPAPSPWRHRLLSSLENTEQLKGIESLEQFADVDKLIAVCLRSVNGQVQIQVRELDIRTQQWGAIVNRNAGQANHIDTIVFQAIIKAFMPIARVENVSGVGEVLIRARAVNTCIQADIEDKQVVPIENSPVWIRPDDRFLPVIRRVDKNGNLAKLEPIDFTYLTIDQLEGSRVTASIHSRERSPLAGRTSKRAQKLALVIRPPESPTILKLVSKEDDKQVLSGYEIWSRQPGQTKEIDSDYLGSTDWRGQFTIEPNDLGLRLIYVKRGNRFLMKLPVIPGLYTEVVTSVPDDEARLNAQGVVDGLNTQVLDLVAQRQVYEAQIKAAIDEANLETATELLNKYVNLTTPDQLKTQMGNEESRLKALTSNRRELEQISNMFQALRDVLNGKIAVSNESELRARLQTAKQKAAGPN